ncbi:hypothetical protein ACIPRL_08055 [Streptomyces sp. NPDC090085]|uniref:hypothetical protein n=1 Tax=Streptomyces sp. NPDC090085 TaxID=3365943 RepID=UPI0037F3CE29
MSDTQPGPLRGILYPVDTYNAAARTITLLNLYSTGQDGTEAVAAEVAEEGQRALLAFTEACALAFSMSVEDLTALRDAAHLDVPRHITGIYEKYGDLPALAEHMPRLLQAAGGRSLDDLAELTAVLTEIGLTPALPLSLARATVMVLRLVELSGTQIADLIDDLEQQMLMRT